MEHSVSSVLNMKYVCERNVIEAVKQIKPKLTTSLDVIPAILLRGCAVAFSSPLQSTFNLIFLLAGKLVVCPVYKKVTKYT